LINQFGPGEHQATLAVGSGINSGDLFRLLLHRETTGGFDLAVAAHRRSSLERDQLTEVDEALARKDEEFTRNRTTCSV